MGARGECARLRKRRKALSTKRCIETRELEDDQDIGHLCRKALSTKRCIETYTGSRPPLNLSLQSESTEHQKVH